MQHILDMFSDHVIMTDYVEQLHQRYSRYIRNQLNLIQQIFTLYERDFLDSVLNTCVDHQQCKQ